MILSQTRPASSGTDAARSGRAGGLRRAAEPLAAVLLGLLVLVVHDVGYLLRQPFWYDESWVAVTSRFPLSQLPATTDAAPVGWAFLVRLFTVSGEQTSRLLPLAFAGAAVVIAYWFGRRLGWRRTPACVLGGILAGTAVLLVPAMLVRDDLKQYTADACLALLVLALTSRLERRWSKAGLAALSAAVWGGMVFSDAAAFAGAAAFAALCVIQLARRAWRRLAESAVAGTATAVLMLGVYQAFDARAVVPGLTATWSRDFPPVGGGLPGCISFAASRFDSVGAYFGLGPAWLALPLVLAGLVTIARLGRPSTALAIAVLWPEMFVIAAVHKYPFLDLRTSTFLFAVTAAVAAIGVAGACSLLQSRLRGTLAAGLAALALAAFTVTVQPSIRGHHIKFEYMRDQTLYVARHASPSDVILVDALTSFGFAYYWPHGTPARRADASVLQGYVPYFPGDPNIVVARGEDFKEVSAALSDAFAREHVHRRIWFVRRRLIRAEDPGWIKARRGDRLWVTPVGRDGLGVLRAGRPRHWRPGQTATAKTDCPNGAPQVPSSCLSRGTNRES